MSAAARPMRDQADDNDDATPPVRRGDASVPAGRRRPRSLARRLGRVLIVDDSWDAREMYGLYFRTAGYDVLMANDGEAAISIARCSKPDAIVMDLAMPGIDGIAATQRLKRHPSTARVPVILLTGHRYRAIEQGALESGVDIFLTKPCLPEDLEQYVASVIAGKRRRR